MLKSCDFMTQFHDFTKFTKYKWFCDKKNWYKIDYFIGEILDFRTESCSYLEFTISQHKVQFLGQKGPNFTKI